MGLTSLQPTVFAAAKRRQDGGLPLALGRRTPDCLRTGMGEMGRRANDFDEADKLKALLWCDRHCCLCGKATGTGIEVAHLDPKRSDLDNAIPLCFDCHAA